MPEDDTPSDCRYCEGPRERVCLGLPGDSYNGSMLLDGHVLQVMPPETATSGAKADICWPCRRWAPS